MTALHVEQAICEAVHGGSCRTRGGRWAGRRWCYGGPAAALRMHGDALDTVHGPLEAQWPPMAVCGRARSESPPSRSTRAKRPAAGPPEGILTLRMPSMLLLASYRAPLECAMPGGKPLEQAASPEVDWGAVAG